MLTLEQTTTNMLTLHPAVVLETAGARMKLELLDQRIWAISAVSFPYHAAVGDLVLAIGDSEAWYVIGVLKGTGRSTLTVPGDLELRAPRGGIVLTAAKGVELQADEVRVTANRIELLARTVFERFTDVTRWVSQTFQLRAGRVRTRVEGSFDLAAQRIVERAERDVKIDGHKIHLG